MIAIAEDAATRTDREVEGKADLVLV